MCWVHCKQVLLNSMGVPNHPHTNMQQGGESQAPRVSENNPLLAGEKGHQRCTLYIFTRSQVDSAPPGALSGKASSEAGSGPTAQPWRVIRPLPEVKSCPNGKVEVEVDHPKPRKNNWSFLRSTLIAWQCPMSASLSHGCALLAIKSIRKGW